MKLSKGRAALVTGASSGIASLAAAFEKHKERFGRLDFCFNNAGVGEAAQVLEDKSNDGTGAWRKIVDINLVAVVDGTRLAVQAMQEQGTGGSVVNTASSSGLYLFDPFKLPVYAASKAGVVFFTRSLAYLAKDGIRVNCICPEFVETGLMGSFETKLRQDMEGVMEQHASWDSVPMPQVVRGVIETAEDESAAGKCMWITKRHGNLWWEFAAAK